MSQANEFCKEAQKFFKDKIHSLNNAIAHEQDTDTIQKLESMLSEAQKDWEKYSKLLNSWDSMFEAIVVSCHYLGIQLSNSL